MGSIREEQYTFLSYLISLNSSGKSRREIKTHSLYLTL
jgi:hypothetical protein